MHRAARFRFLAHGLLGDQVVVELRKAEQWADYLQLLRQGKGEPYFLDASCAVDNYGVLNQLGLFAYVVSDPRGEGYRVTEGLANAVRGAHAAFSQGRRPAFRVAYLLYDKRILPANVRAKAGRNDEILLENKTFLLARAAAAEPAASADVRAIRRSGPSGDEASQIPPAKHD